jgi:hypothetical protein
VVELLGETRGALVLRSRYPKTFNRALLDYCTDERTYEICVTMARDVKRRI